MNFKLLKASLLSAAAVLAAVSCVSIDQEIIIAPISTAVPVSASSSVFSDGNTIKDDGYRIMEAFSMSANLKNPVNADEPLVYDLTPYLEDTAEKTQADALTDLKIQLIDADTSALTWMSIEQYIGIIGLGFLGYGIYHQLAVDPDSPEFTIGGASAAALGIGGYFLHKSLGNINYELVISGNAVRFSR